MRGVWILAVLVFSCSKPAPPVVPDAAPPDAAIAVIPRPPGASFACGKESCHSQQYCRHVKQGDAWSTIACAAVPDPCREAPTCACLGTYGVTGECTLEAGHPVVKTSY